MAVERGARVADQLLERRAAHLPGLGFDVDVLAGEQAYELALGDDGDAARLGLLLLRPRVCAEHEDVGPGADRLRDLAAGGLDGLVGLVV